MRHSDELIDWLYALRGPSLKWDIETAAGFSRWLGHPWRAYPCAHVAGTNGKGSVAAMLHAIGSAAGLRCGLFTSPHLVTPEERIRVGPDDLDPERFRSLVGELRSEASRALEAGALSRHPSFFEMMTAAAMRSFSEPPVDLAVFETGLGGRLDATNVIVPAISIITTVSLDHTKTLGESTAAIAREKGGIIKAGIPVLVGWIEGEPLDALRHIAHRVGAPIHEAAREVRLEDEGEDGFAVVTPEGRHSRLQTRLEGSHQERNAALAVRAAELLRRRGVPVSADAIRRGLRDTRWPGRLESIGRAPAVLLDAAHNEEGIAALASYLEEKSPATTEAPARVLVFGLTDGRDPVSLLGPLRGLFDRVVVTAADTPRAQDPAELGRRISESGPFDRVDVEPSLPAALDLARTRAGPRGEVVVAGSIYLVGDARRVLLRLEGPGHVSRERLPDLPSSVDSAAEPGRASACRP
jgi:dihydrofolate synthase/folylpolyglutamate synthase